MNKQLLLFGGLVVLGIMIGGMIATYLFFGIVTLMGFITLVESIPVLKWFVKKTSRVIDVLIFVGTIVATASLGPTITASLTIAGLGFTMVYAPLLRKNHKK